MLMMAQGLAVDHAAVALLAVLVRAVRCAWRVLCGCHEVLFGCLALTSLSSTSRNESYTL